MTQTRVPAGVPSGGQFADSPRSDAEIELSERELQRRSIDAAHRNVIDAVSTLLDESAGDTDLVHDAVYDAIAGWKRQPSHASRFSWNNVSPGDSIRLTQQPPALASDADLADWLNDADTATGVDSVWSGLDDGFSDGYGVAVAFDRPVRDPVHLLAYFMRGPMAVGEDGFDGHQRGIAINPTIASDGHRLSRVWMYWCDLTKSRRDDPAYELGELPRILQEGSPVRSTNRAGPGTAGTRAVDGFGDVNVAIAIRD
jgi:hypothetical protein